MTLEQLSHDTFYNGGNYSQLTIDFIEEVEDTLSGEYFGDQERKDVLSSISYIISSVLEIINPSLETDKKALLNLIEIIKEV